MQAWVIYYYGDNQQFTLSDSVQMPVILSPKDVLIKISASSVNPVDIRRRGKSIIERILLIKIDILEGYGGKLIDTYQSVKNALQLGGSQSNKLEFPLILGRDFCGEIIRKGPQVTKFNVGDKVRRNSLNDFILIYSKGIWCIKCHTTGKFCSILCCWRR
jgi:NADPH:quinone reductase-like Zn-dependent oxidoreductase